jgi:hypothetical protein
MGSTKAFGVTRVDPVCRLINDPQEAFWIYEGLQQYHGMHKNLLPIIIKALLHKGRMREPKFEICQSGRIRKRLLLMINLRRSY